MRVERVVPILRGERRRASNSDARFNEDLLGVLGERRNEVRRGEPLCGDRWVRFSMTGGLRMGMCAVQGICVRSNFGAPQKRDVGEWGPDSRAIIAKPQSRGLVTG